MTIHHTLPLEILSEILRCVVAHTEIWAVETLRLVCREWDNIVLGEPSFWSTIEINLEDPASRPPAHIVSSWLSRSKSSMLYISLEAYPIVDGLTIEEGGDESHDIDLEYFAEVFTLLAAHASRWRTFYISTGDEVLISPIFLDSLVQAKSLQRASFNLLDIDDAQPETRLSVLASTLDQLPSLRSLSISLDGHAVFMEIPHLFHHQLLPSTLSRILDLHIDRVNILTVLTIVRNCQSLKSLSLCYMAPSKSTTYPSRIRLPSLETLTFHNNPWDVDILPRLDLPSLDALSISPDMMDDCHGPSFVQNLTRSIANASRIPRVLRLRLLFQTPPLVIVPLVACSRLSGVPLLLVYTNIPQEFDSGLDQLRIIADVLKEAGKGDMFITNRLIATGWIDWAFYNKWASETTNGASLAIAESIRRSFCRKLIPLVDQTSHIKDHNEY